MLRLSSSSPHDLEHYDMSKNKILLIFNNRDFPKSKYRKEPLDSLSGNDGDQQRLTRVFTAFGFRVLPYLNLDAEQILDVIAKFNEEEDHSETSCVCVAVMTHGDSSGTLHAADRSYNLRDLVEPLQFGHQGLVGKPKLFLVSACRGGDLDPGRVELDGPGSAALGSHSDTLVLTACVEGFISWQYIGCGSWLLQELCGVLERRHRDLHLLDMATLTTSLVTRRHQARVVDEQARREVIARQTPESRSTLTKLLRFSLAQR